MSTLKRVLALTLALVMAMSVGVFAVELKDADTFDPTCVDAINLLTALKIIQGYEDGTFRPEGTITRAEAAKMIYVLCNGGVDDGAPAFAGLDMFYDAKGHWAANYINFCASLDIIAGRGNGRFDPNAPVTGYELAKMLLVVANYNPTVQVYTGTNWKVNVLRDSQRSGLVSGYDWMMDQPAPRQWAAQMFATLITKVKVAEYAGDILVTGTGLESQNAKMVGESYLKLVMFTGQLVQTKTLNIGGGADSYNRSVIANGDLNYDFTSNTAANINADVALDFDVSNDLLGQEVMVVGKVLNPNLNADALVNEKNMTTLAVYSTEKSRVYDTTLGNVTFGRTSATGSFTVKTAGYNGGNAMTYPNAQYVALLENFYNNAFENYDIDTTIAPYVAGGGTSTAPYPLSRKGMDKIRLIDYDADGYIDYAFIEELFYGKVASITSTRISAGNLSTVLADVTFENGTPEVGDVIAYAAVYGSGDRLYEARIVPPTENVSVTKWTGSDTDPTQVTIDGKNYNRAAGYFAAANKAHQVYYIDGTYFAGSAAAHGQTVYSVPSTLAVVTNISGYPTNKADQMTNTVGDPTTTYGFYVEYMKADGTKSGKKLYSFDNETNTVGYFADGWQATAGGGNNTWANSGKFVGTGGSNNADRVWDELVKLIDLNKAPKFVRVRENSDGSVTFFNYTSSTDAADVVVNSYVRTSDHGYAASFSSKTGRLDYFNNTTSAVTYVTKDTQVYFRYDANYTTLNNAGTYKMIKGDSLFSFGLTAKTLSNGDNVNYYVDAILNNSADGSALAIYITTNDTKLPEPDKTKYAIINATSFGLTYGHDGSTSANYITAIDEEGNSFSLVVDDATKTAMTNAAGSASALRYKMVSYTEGSIYDTVTVLSITDVIPGYISNMNTTDKYVVLNQNNGTRYYYDDSTVIFDVRKDAASISVLDQPYSANNQQVQNVGIIQGTGSAGEAVRVILINGDQKYVGGNNVIGGTITGITVSISGTGTNNTLGYAVPGKELTATVSGSSVTPSYQWYVDGAAVSGATANKYTPKASDQGKLLFCEVSFTGYNGTFSSSLYAVARHVDTIAATAKSMAATTPGTGPIMAQGASIVDNNSPVFTATLTGSGITNFYYMYYVNDVLVHTSAPALTGARTAAQLISDYAATTQGAGTTTLTGLKIQVIAVPFGYYCNGVSDNTYLNITLYGAPNISVLGYTAGISLVNDATTGGLGTIIAANVDITNATHYAYLYSGSTNFAANYSAAGTLSYTWSGTGALAGVTGTNQSQASGAAGAQGDTLKVVIKSSMYNGELSYTITDPTT